MSRPDPLAVSLVEAAFELHRRRLWLEVPGDAPFLVRVPGEEHPLVASIIGHEGSDYGLVLTCGEAGFAQVESCILDGRDRAEDFEAQAFLSVTLETLASIPAELRGVLAAAGFQARRENLAPYIFSKPAYRAARGPSRSQMRSMLACLRAVFAVHDAGEFRPTSLDRRKKRIFQIVVEGEGRAAKARAQVVPWPSSNSPRELEVFAELREIDPGLPRLDVGWLVAFALVPGAGLTGGRNLGVSFVAEMGTRRTLSTEATTSGDPRAVAAQMAKLLSAGMPREIVFANPDLHEALAPALATLGIPTTLDPDQADLAQFKEDFADKLEALVDADESFETETKSVPVTLEEWRAVDRDLTERLIEEVKVGRALTPRALSRYFGSEDLARQVFRELERFQPLISVMEWLYADYRATKKSATILEGRLKRASTTPLERTLIEARIGARLSIYRVDAATPGATLEVEDIFDGTRVTIHERALSGCGVEGLHLPMRITKLGEWTVTALAGPPLSQFQIDPALALLESLGVELSSDGLRRSAHLLGRLWELVLDRQRHPPKLANTDGEPLVWHTATFRVADGAALARALGKRRDVEYDKAQGEWTWSRPGAPVPGFGDNTLLGRLEMIGDRLVLEVNSAARLARARQWLEALPGVSFERATARELLSESRPVDDKLPARPVKVEPEMLRVIEQMHRDFLRGWLDQPIPALGGLSPRQACKTAEGRRQVERLVRTMPAATYPGGTLPPPRDELLRELGIGR